MLRFNSLIIKEAIVNSGEAIESGDHFKNGANPKSQTSRVNLKEMKQFAVILFLLVGVCFFSCKKNEECPVQVYSKQLNKPTDEQWKKYKPYIDIINSMGEFWIEVISETNVFKGTRIDFECTQLFNGLLLIDTPIGFQFYTDDVEEWMDWSNNELPCTSYHKKDGVYFMVGNMSPTDVQLPVVPKIKPHDAIQTALKKEPLVEFCQYELCYYARNCGNIPLLCWKLYGMGHVYYGDIKYGRGYNAYVDAISGNLLEGYYGGSYPHPKPKE